MLLEKRELLDCSMSKMKLFKRPGAHSVQQYFKPAFSATGLFKLKLKQQGSNVEISWDHLNVQEQATFIKSYTVYYYTNSQKQLNRIEGIVKSSFLFFPLIFGPNIF